MSVAVKNIRLLAVCTAILGAAQASADGLDPIVGALGEWKPIIDVRLRYEGVEQAPIVRDADAYTIRARLGVETGKAWNTALLVEGEFVEALVEDYNSTTNLRTRYPVVVDPENEEINRLQLTNTSIDQTAITLGRQRINLDDQRFVGAVGWRQNEQTFDALRVVNRSVANFAVDVTYFNRVNRIFGKDSPQGKYRGDNFLGNIAYQTKFGKATAFSYLLKFDPLRNGPVGMRNSSRNESTATYGVRFAGDKPVGPIKLTYAASYATQEDYGDNLLNFENEYYLAELTAGFRQFSAGLGYELLDGNGVKGFTTPLATLHKFNGWADRFLVTPANGLEDVYASVAWTTKGLGPFDTVSATAIYHEFESSRRAVHQEGSELNLLLSAKYQRFTGIVKYADYESDGLSTDLKKIWLEVGFVW
jgi:hypothetical protein